MVVLGRLRGRRLRVLLLAGLVFVVVGVAVLLHGSGGGGGVGIVAGLTPRALYYDPLWRNYPNETLVDLVVEELGRAGYRVDVVLGSDAGLLELDVMDGYSIVIIRSHGAYSNGSLGPRGPYIYTGLLVEEAEEEYGGRIDVMLSQGMAAQAVIPPEGPLVPVPEEELVGLPRYLAVGPGYFNATPYYFNNTVILVASCYSMGDEYVDPVIGEILASKGASGYAGFQGVVSWATVDMVIGEYVRLIGSGLDPLTALERLEDLPPDPVGGGRIVVYTSRV